MSYLSVFNVYTGIILLQGKWQRPQKRSTKTYSAMQRKINYYRIVVFIIRRNKLLTVSFSKSKQKFCVKEYLTECLMYVLNFKFFRT